MAQQMPSENEKALADSLRRNAESTRPEFSEALHAKICQAVRESGPRPRLPGIASSSKGVQAYIAVAVAAALCVVLIVRQMDQTSGPTTIDVPRIVEHEPAPPIEKTPVEQTPDGLASFNGLVGGLTVNVPQRVDERFDSAFDGPLAELGHDVRLAASFLTEPLPLEMLASVDRL